MIKLTGLLNVFVRNIQQVKDTFVCITDCELIVAGHTGSAPPNIVARLDFRLKRSAYRLPASRIHFDNLASSRGNDQMVTQADWLAARRVRRGNQLNQAGNSGRSILVDAKNL